MKVRAVGAPGGRYFAASYVRDEMIKRGHPRYNWQTSKWEWGELPKEGQSEY
jgi:hypothetical protein